MSPPLDPTLGGPALAWDSSAILHARRIDRLDVLLYLADSLFATPVRHVTTAAVAEELSSYELTLPGRLDVVHADTLAELKFLGAWLSRLSSSEHNRGEATVCAWGQAHSATVIMDDRGARSAAVHVGLDVHGTAWVIAPAVVVGAETEAGAGLLADNLAADGARYPFRPGGFLDWAKGMGLLSP